MSSYDKYPFISRPSYSRHPDFICGALELSGFKPPDWKNLLEIGCGSGSFLICLARFHPEKNFIGVDSNKSSVEKAKQIAKKLNLNNIEFVACDIVDFDFKTFSPEVILAYGLYSWIKKEKRKELLAYISKNLKANGFCVLNHNLLPGWGVRGELSNILKKCADSPASVRAKLSEIGSSTFSGISLKEEAQNILADASDSFIMHELLNPELAAFSLEEFKKDAKEQGLIVHDPDKDILEEYIDTKSDFNSRTIRNAVLLKEQNFLNAEGEFIKNCFFTSKLVNDESPSQFFAPNGKKHSFDDRLTQSILGKLSSSWPCSIPLSSFSKEFNQVEILQRVKKLIGLNFVEAYSYNLPVVSDVSSLPKAEEVSLVSELYAGFTSNSRFEYTHLSDEMNKVLRLCDGQRDIKEICKISGSSLERVEVYLSTFIEMALLKG